MPDSAYESEKETSRNITDMWTWHHLPMPNPGIIHRVSATCAGGASSQAAACHPRELVQCAAATATPSTSAARWYLRASRASSARVRADKRVTCAPWDCAGGGATGRCACRSGSSGGSAVACGSRDTSAPVVLPLPPLRVSPPRTSVHLPPSCSRACSPARRLPPASPLGMPPTSTAERAGVAPPARTAMAVATTAPPTRCSASRLAAASASASAVSESFASAAAAAPAAAPAASPASPSALACAMPSALSSQPAATRAPPQACSRATAPALEDTALASAGAAPRLGKSISARNSSAFGCPRRTRSFWTCWVGMGGAQ
eukprot:351486-Chlamydomonas_euryale.AAC.10